MNLFTSMIKFYNFSCNRRIYTIFKTDHHVESWSSEVEFDPGPQFGLELDNIGLCADVTRKTVPQLDTTRCKALHAKCCFEFS